MESNDQGYPIVFDKPFMPGKYSLIQVTKSLAENIRQSKTFVIRSRPEDNVCFCTDTETYRVKEVETTDTLFVTNKIEPSDDGESKEYKIKGYLQTFLELTKEEGSPYLALKGLCKKYVYNGSDDGMTEKLTMNDLLERIQFSEYEIRQGLKQLPVIEIEGFLLFLSRSTRSQLLDKLIELIDDPEIPSINLKQITFDDLKSYFHETPESIIQWIIRTYTNNNGSINQTTVCRDRAISFFEKNHEVSQVVFERQMIRLLPMGLEMDLSALQGVALFKKSIVHGTLIDYVNVEDLPDDANERLNMLFKIKESWTMEEIEPYIIEFCLNKTAVAPFLLKHCQQVKDGMSRCFVKKDNDFE